MRHRLYNTLSFILSFVFVICSVPCAHTAATTERAYLEWENDESLLCGASGCEVNRFCFDGTIEEYLGYDPYTAGGINSSPHFDVDGNSFHYYQALNTTDKQLYDAILSGVENYLNSSSWGSDLDAGHGTIRILAPDNGHTYTDSEFTRIGRSFLCDNIRNYWMKNSLSYGTVEGRSVIEFYVDPYYYSKERRDDTEARLTSVVNEITLSLRNDPDICKGDINDNYRIALRLHDILIGLVNYTYNSSGKPETAIWAHSVAGILLGKGAVCEGYAKAFSLILNVMGIDNYYIEGTSSGTGHAWNAVCLNDRFYLCDVTWDDPNLSSFTDTNEANYAYFCIPESVFSKDHTPDKSMKAALPDFADTLTYTFFSFFHAYSASTLTAASASELVTSAYDHKFRYSDYLFFLVPDETSIIRLGEALNIDTDLSYRKTALGYIFKKEMITVTVPATSVSLNTTVAEIERGGSVQVTASVSADSDDRISWSVDNPTFVRLKPMGKTCTVVGSRNSTVVLTATTLSGKVSSSCIIKVGTGVAGSDVIVWLNGTKALKTGTITPLITATNWKNSRGATVKGKLVWLVESEKTDIQFDVIKHTVTTKSNNKAAVSVSNKGVVTAKATGSAYIYVCDTGTLTYEEYEATVLGAPSKLVLSKVADSTDRANSASRIGIEAGSTVRIYVVPSLTKGDYEVTSTYTASIDKEAQKAYIEVSEVSVDEEGHPFFYITGKTLDEAKSRNATAKVNIVCNESGKKVSCTVTVGNPVTDILTTVTKASGEQISAHQYNGALAKRNSTMSFRLSFITDLGIGTKTADTVKLVVGLTSVTLDGKRVVTDRGSTVRATLDKKTMTVTLKMTAKECSTGVVYAVVTNSLDKSLNLIPLCNVQADGTVTFSSVS